MKKEVSGVRMVLGYFGIFLVLVGIITAVPMVMMVYPGESKCYIDFLIPVTIDIVLGLILYFVFLCGRKRAKFLRHQDSVLLVAVWLAAIVSGAAPMFIAGIRGEMEMTFSEAIFETTSAYSTTGLNVFKDFLDSPDAFCPHVFTFLRSWMQFIGGVGFVLILASILGGNTSMSLYQGEGHNDRILASLRKTAQVILGIYSAYMVVGALALFLSGLPLFDAFNISMCALSGGGLSLRSSNIAFYEAYEGEILNYHFENGVKVMEVGNGAFFPVNFVAIEIIMMVLVTLSAVSFVLHTFVLTGKWKKFLLDEETRFGIISFFLLFAFSYGGYLTVALSATSVDTEDLGKAAMDCAFYIVGSATTSGFSNTDLPRFLSLGEPLFFASILAMFMGGGVGSTGGGMKQYRVVTCLKSLYYSLRYRFLSAHSFRPKTIYRYGKMQELDDDTVSEAYHYGLLFLAMVVISVLIGCIAPNGDEPYTQMDLPSVLYNVVSASSNTGYGVSDFLAYRRIFGASSWGYNLTLWVLTIDMFLGRLEIIPLFYALSNIPKEIKYRASLRKAERSGILAEKGAES
ncbi:MAG: potassium transporter TrkG [Candidatus Enteromonas sp.]|nr:potassium transporter TrkG [Candidatus Enteromonas sp.]